MSGFRNRVADRRVTYSRFDGPGTPPTAGLLDSFNAGAAQNLTARSGWSAAGKWNSGDGTWVTDATPTYATNNNLTASNIWNTSFGPDMEATFTEGSAIDTVILLLRGNSNTAAQTAGYIARVGWNGICSIETVGTSTLASVTISPNPVAGDQFCFQVIGSQLTLWRKLASDGVWREVLGARSTLYSGTGYIGVAGSSGNNARIDSFSGGTIPVAGGGGLTQMTFTSAGTGTSTFTLGQVFAATGALYGLPYNADALNNREIGSSANRKIGLRFRAPVSANLSNISLALAYGPGYSAGTGGSVKAALQADDGTASHFPSGTDLTSVTVSTPVGADGTESMVTFTFGSPQAVTAGTLYHVVLTQQDASPTVNWVSYDGTWSTTPTTPMQRANPLLGTTTPDLDFFMNLKDGAAAWFADPSTSPSPVNLHFSDGTDFGWSVDYTPVVAALRNVGGVNLVREKIVAAYSGNFTGVRVRLYRQSGTTVALAIKVKDSGGSVLYSSTVAAASIVAKAAGSNPADGTWVGFDTAISLTVGSTYYIELSAPTETVFYQAYPLRTSINANWSGAAKANRFAEAQWEYSTNSGGAWSLESSDTSYKMQAYFIGAVSALTALTFTSTGTGTSTFTLNRFEGLTFTSTGLSTSTFTLTRRRPLTFTSTGLSTSTFLLNRARPLTFTSAGLSTSTFTLTQRRALTFTSTGLGTSTFLLNRREGLTFTSTGLSASTFTLTRVRPLTFTSTGLGTSTFTLNRRRPLAFTSTGISTSTFALTTQHAPALTQLTFTSAGTSTSTWLLNRRRPLTFTSAGTSTSTFALTLVRPLAFTSTGTGASTFTLNRRRPLTFTSTGTSTSVFALNRRRPLTFTSAGTSTSVFSLNLSAYDVMILNDTPVAYWSPRGGAGTSPDLTGHGHTATPVGTPTATTTPNGDTAMVLDGITQCLEVASNADLSVPATGIISIEAWVRLDTLDFPTTIASADGPMTNYLGKGENFGGSGKQEYHLRYYNRTTDGVTLSNRPSRYSAYAFNPAGGSGSGSFEEKPRSVGEWTHIVMVIDTVVLGGDGWGTIRIYRDGKLRDFDSLGLTFSIVPVAGTGLFRIGTYGTVADVRAYWKGGISKVAVYNYALTPTQVTTHFTSMLGFMRASIPPFTSAGSGTSVFALTTQHAPAQTQLTFTSAGTSSSTFALTRRRALAFTSTGTGTSTFTLNRGRPLAFTSTGTSTSTFALGRIRQLAFASTGISTSTFTLNRREALAFTSAGTSTSVFALNRLRPLAFTSPGIGTSTFALNRRRPLAFTSTGTSTSTFAMTRLRTLALTSTGTSTTTFALTQRRNLTFTSSGIGATTFVLTVPGSHFRNMAFTSAGVGTSIFALAVKHALAFTSAGVGTSTFALNRRRALAFTSTGTSASTFLLNRRRPLAFTSAGTSTSVFTLAVKRALVFTSAGVGTSTFTFAAKRALVFTSPGVGTSTFLLTRRRALSFASSGVGASSFLLNRRRGMAFVSAGLSASSFALTVRRRLVFFSTGTSTSLFAITVLRIGGIVITTVNACSDPVGGVVDCATPVPSLVLVDDPLGGTVSCPTPGKVG